MAVYLNTYETYQAYGGPEEGGWWYQCGEPVQSVLITDQDYEEWFEYTPPEERYEMCDHATRLYTRGESPTPANTGYGGYTFVVGSDEPATYREDNSYKSFFEDHFAEAYPKERPHYE